MISSSSKIFVYLSSPDFIWNNYLIFFPKRKIICTDSRLSQPSVPINLCWQLLMSTFSTNTEHLGWNTGHLCWRSAMSTAGTKKNWAVSTQYKCFLYKWPPQNQSINCVELIIYNFTIDSGEILDTRTSWVRTWKNIHASCRMHSAICMHGAHCSIKYFSLKFH